jgi:multimeric flavodoxin WrbA
MKIVILNGNPGPKNSDTDRYVRSLAGELVSGRHDLDVFNLRDMDIRYCTGCWSCWCKTPGTCVHRDDMPAVYKSVVRSDLLLFASPVIAGFMSALLKRANERLIPLIHPYIVLDEGECHHRGRYDRYPDWGLVLHKGNDADDEDIEIISNIYARDALNLKARLRLVLLTTHPVKEARRAIDAL